ncbi:MAG TPA: M20 family metallopeptidase [Clostridia bacterium]|nr:M20 family metallopeptidase [Clostridia bacterium]
MKDLIIKEIQGLGEQLSEISDYICSNPEMGNNEFKAMEKLTSFLKVCGFSVETNIINKPTAFKAVYDSLKPGPSVSFLCEYDALPGIGHGCGHNMIGTMGCGAAVGLSKVLDKTGGRLIVLGTPAEETDGAKVAMAENGVFSDIDAAMILHPEDTTYESGSSLAMDALQFDFKGKSSHAAASPHEGINALDAVILTFNGINALRQHVTSDVRIHGIVKEGGKAANIVPDRAIAQFYVRAGKKKYLKKVAEKVKNIARGAAMMTGASLEISNYEISYDDMNTNQNLSKAFVENLKQVGVNDIHPQRSSSGSIDMGNVSNVVPAIHPYISISDTKLVGHTSEFRDATMTDKAHDALIKGSCALALTGYDVLTDKELLKRIKEEFASIGSTPSTP